MICVCEYTGTGYEFQGKLRCLLPTLVYVVCYTFLHVRLLRIRS